MNRQDYTAVATFVAAMVEPRTTVRYVSQALKQFRVDCGLEDAPMPPPVYPSNDTPDLVGSLHRVREERDAQNERANAAEAEVAALTTAQNAWTAQMVNALGSEKAKVEELIKALRNVMLKHGPNSWAADEARHVLRTHGVVLP